MTNIKSYTVLFIISPDKKETFGEVKTSISAVISDNSGKVVRETEIGDKRLAYPIMKKTEGVYYEVAFTAPSESIEKMTKQFEINTDILRTLISAV